jgi:hypothetical protein
MGSAQNVGAELLDEALVPLFEFLEELKSTGRESRSSENQGKLEHLAAHVRLEYSTTGMRFTFSLLLLVAHACVRQTLTNHLLERKHVEFVPCIHEKRGMSCLHAP